MQDIRKQKLIQLGIDALADALIKLSLQSPVADKMVERMIATPEDNVKRFKQSLAGLKRSKRFIDWQEASNFATKLEAMLEDLQSGISAPLLGVELISMFFEADKSVFERCDDSDGYIGDIFRYNAVNLFAEFASQCGEKDKVADIIVKLNHTDDYGVRHALVDSAGGFLPEHIIRSMITEFQKQANKEKNKEKRHYRLMPVESLARQIKDAKLFEATCLESCDEPSISTINDIASVYLECGDVENAHSWIKKIPKNTNFQERQSNKILLEIFKQKGDTDQAAKILLKQFKASRTDISFQALLDVVGTDKKNEIIASEIPLIMDGVEFKEVDADFLITFEQIDEAEQYIYKHACRIKGEFYYSLLPLVKKFESAGRNLAASLIYRRLLISILDRGYIKAYPYGAKYLKKLDKLAITIYDWQNFQDHQVFIEQIRTNHKRKSSFWLQYDDIK